MPFESLSYRHTLHLPNVPHRWLPLICLYDPDLPLFPIYYFHVLRTNLDAVRPQAADRAFGYVEHVNVNEQGGIDVGIVVNKNLALAANKGFLDAVESEINERFGIVNPVRLQDVSNSFQPPLEYANNLLIELWHRVVANAYGDLLPFGRLWDAVLGLARFVASWYSPSGRKGEIIQTHYFARAFGVRIPAAEGIPQLDFYLVPSISELIDPNNPLTEFPHFRELLRVAQLFVQHYGEPRAIGSLTLSRFVRPFGGLLNTDKLLAVLRGPHIPNNLRRAAVECFNAFDKGPMRTVIFLLMLNDLRAGLLRPAQLTSAQCGELYHRAKGSYQSPKAIQIYAQQCFGNTEAIPVDTWIETFLKWPLRVYPTLPTNTPLAQIFSHTQLLGKVERLIWVTVQARKVHSAACDDAIWCVKYGADQEPKTSRGANPFGCNICLENIRDHCPAFAAIRHQSIGFNGSDPLATFQVATSAGDNVTPNQFFDKCSGNSIYSIVMDKFSPADKPMGFAPFPSLGHNGDPMTVEDFVNTY